MNAVGPCLLLLLDTAKNTVPHGPGFLCRLTTPGLPPIEGVAETATEAATMAGYYQRAMASIYVQAWAKA